MAITDLPLFSMLRTRMHWHQERQRLLAENISHADTPQYRPKDLAPPQFDRRPPPPAIGLMRTEGAHIAAVASSSASQFHAARMGSYDVRPTGNAVNLEDEMIKVAGNQMDYQAVTTLYQRSLGLLKTAMGRR
jgi:flagellar basal-body rod protein FlgB